MPPVRDRALVLERHPWSESSLVVHVATAAHGRVHLVARGAYRPGSRFYCVLDLFDTLELEWNQVAGRELLDLRAGDLARRRKHVAATLPTYKAGVTVLELLALASRFGPPDALLFARAEATLDALDLLGASALEDALPAAPKTAALPSSADVELARFELAYLAHLGFAPALVTCAACAGPAPAERGRVPFSAGAGGRLCARCAEEGRARNLRVGTLPLGVLEDAERLESGTWPVDAAPERIVRARDWIERFLDYHLETRPRSHRSFLSAPNRNAPRTGAAGA
ncbi:MAG: recombination protein O N-terminal domain-containing protein [Planctomycetes bacterium]|nr:recombination protein O N-terminal domain-containing protein [Planctomycetota bacterium]